ncbi:uracil-DNA glycosylase [Gemmatimonadota bacterium]
MDRHDQLQWLSDAGRFLRQFSRCEGDILLAASAVSREDERVVGDGLPPEKQEMNVEDQSGQPGLLSVDQLAADPEITGIPWHGGPPRQDIDQVGVPESMICPIPDGAGRLNLLARLGEDLSPCLKCSLGETRNTFVFGTGNPDANVMFIGEAPGRDEDIQGEPFVGRAGKLLNKIIESIGFTREEVYIGNILKCRPPDNRDPRPDEVDACEPHLHRQIALIRPAVICALGRIAAQTLLKSTATLGKLRERVHLYQGVPLVVTYHPAALLRNPNWKRPTWEDMQLLRSIHDEAVLK